MRLRHLSLILLLALVANACGSDDPEGAAAGIYSGECADSAGESITVYSGRTENLMEPVFDAFVCESGIDVEVRWADSAQLALLIDEEGDRTAADVYLSRSPGPVGFLQANDLLGQLNQSTLDLVDERYRDPNGQWVGFTGRKRVLVYNVDNVEESELPDSVFELTDPEWKGIVAIPATNGSFVDWFTVFRAQNGDEVATQWLDDMVANDAHFYANNRAIVEAVGRGEIEVGLVNHYYNFQEQAALGDDHRGQNYDFSDDDIGSLLLITAAAIPAASDDVDSAHALINFLLSEPAQTYFTDETLEYPLASDVEPNDALPPLDAGGASAVDFASLGDGFEETTAIIDESGISNQ
jgi:iron(III) transport system substrate-binding protein